MLMTKKLGGTAHILMLLPLLLFHLLFGFARGFVPRSTQASQLRIRQGYSRQPAAAPFLAAAAATTSKTQQEELLLPAEVALWQRDERPITTLTWFRGESNAAASILQARLKQILQCNPWLMGRVMPRNNNNNMLYLTFTETDHDTSEYNDDSLDNKTLPNYFCQFTPQQSRIHRRTRLNQLAQECPEDAILKNGPQEPLLRVSIIPCRIKPAEHFALVVSLSHVVADGHTYYKLLEMLCSSNDNDTNKIAPLIYQRISTSPNQQAQAMGQANYDYVAKPGLAAFANLYTGLVQTRTIGPVPQAAFALVNDKRMVEEKQQAVAAFDNNISPAPTVPFLSTNDVLTSWFLRRSGAAISVMAINFRDRLDGHTANHAGNYENVIPYRQADVAHPAWIRKSIMPDGRYRRAVTTDEPLPAFWETLGTTTAVVTNWATLTDVSFVIPNCQEELHLPLYDFRRTLPTGAAVMIIFRAGPSRTGIFVAAAPDVMTKLGLGNASRRFGGSTRSRRPSFLETKSLL